MIIENVRELIKVFEDDYSGEGKMDGVLLIDENGDLSYESALNGYEGWSIDNVATWFDYTFRDEPNYDPNDNPTDYDFNYFVQEIKKEK
jgi:hypothetical protein